MYEGAGTYDAYVNDCQTLAKADTGGGTANYAHGTFSIEFIMNVQNTTAYVKPRFSAGQYVKTFFIIVEKL